MEGEQRDARCRYFEAERRDSNWYMKPVKDTSGMGFSVHNSSFEETLEALERSVNRDVKRGIDTLYKVKGTNAHHGNYGYGNHEGPFVLQKWEFMTSEFDQFKSLFVNSIQYVDAGEELSSLTDEEIEDRWYYASTKKDVKKMDFKAEFDKQVAKNRGTDVKKYGYSRLVNGMDEFIEIEEPMSKEEAKKLVLSRLGRYDNSVWVRAILSLIADGNEREYKNLYDEYFENNGMFD